MSSFNIELQKAEKFALNFLQEARQRSIAFWNHPTETVIKGDKSPVTELDRSLEQLFRETALKEFPTYGVIGEEFGNSNRDAEFQWVIDPIDGTMSMVNRVPTFGTMIALMHNNIPIWGAIDHPITNIMHYGSVATGGVYDETGTVLPLFKKDERALKEVMIATAAPGTFHRSDKISVLQGLIAKLPNIRIYYDCFAHSMVLRGGIASNVDVGLRIWDVAAPMAMIKARGGECFLLYPWSGETNERLGLVFGAPGITEKLYHLVQELMK